MPAVTAASLAVLLAACGGGSSASKAASNPYDLQQPGTLRVGTLTDAPPNVYLKDGKFTGFDNDLLTAVAAKVGLKVQFAGTDFSALLAQVNAGRFDVGELVDHHHRGPQEDRGLRQRLRLRLLRSGRARRLDGEGLRPGAGQARRRRPGHRAGRLRDEAEPRPGARARLQRGAEPPAHPDVRRVDRARRDRREVGEGQQGQDRGRRDRAQPRPDGVRGEARQHEGEGRAGQGSRRGHRRRHLDEACRSSTTRAARCRPTSSPGAAP
nr:transporter substrate-binding domain-containing protein [Angustibacter aerolatus]